MSDSLQKFMDLSLREFAESLKCSEEYRAEGTQLVDKVGRKIADKTKFSLGERRVGGSVGKNTDVIAPDFDIVFAVNNVEGQTPPFKTVLDDFHDIILLHEDELKIQPGSLEWNGEFSLKFTFRNGIDVDLLPACNLPYADIRQKMLDNKKESRRYSSSLVKQAVGFMKVQDGFTHSIVRLGKFWFKSCHFGKKVHGGSTMIELISVAAAMNEIQMQEKSELRGLTRVIEMAQNIDKIKIAFRMTLSRKWELIPVEILNKGNVSFGDWEECNESTLKRGYYLIEPANPLNDLLRDKSPELIAKMKKYAGVTRQRLDALMKDKYTSLGNAEEKLVEFEKIFEPQPSNLKTMFPTGVPCHARVFMENSYSSIYPDVEVKNEEPLERVEVKDVVHALKRNIMWTVKAFQRGFPEGIPPRVSSTSSREQLPKKNMCSLVQKLIETNIQGESGESFWFGDFDVVITVPFRTTGGIQAVCVGMNWN